MNLFKKPDIKFFDLLFFIVVIISLYPLIVNKYFLTGDGPCHVYNSKVLLDIITGNHIDFYDKFYYLNTNLEPNWLSHFSLAILLSIFPAFLAEKILLVIYILLFSFSLRYLIKCINPANGFIVLLGLPFMFQFTFLMGFYNYSFSFAFMFLSVGYWLKNNEQMNIKRSLILASLQIILFFSHPIGFFINHLIIGLIICTGFLISLFNRKERSVRNFKHYLDKILQYILIALPGILLIISYVLRKGLASVPNPDTFSTLLDNFFKMTSLSIISNNELYLSSFYFWFFAAILIYAIISKIRYKNFKWTDAFFPIFLIMIYLYFNQPGGIAGAGVLSIRLQFIPFIILVLWLSTVKFHRISIYIISFIGFIIGISLIFLRLPAYSKASEAVKEIMELSPYIESESTVLGLSYSLQGKTPE
jgi:hypothetical protein